MNLNTLLFAFKEKARSLFSLLFSTLILGSFLFVGTVLYLLSQLFASPAKER